MSDPIRSSLNYLRTHTLGDAARRDFLPAGRNLAARVSALAAGVLARGVETLQDEDLFSLRQIYDNPDLPAEQKQRIFKIYLQMSLKDVDPDLKEARAGEIATRINPLLEFYIVGSIGMIPGPQRTEQALLNLISLFEGIAIRKPLDKILYVLVLLPPLERSSIIAAALPLMRGVIRGRAQILSATAELPPARRGAIITAALRLVLRAEDGYKRAVILQIMNQIPTELLTQENLVILESFVERLPLFLLHIILRKIGLLAPLTRISAMRMLLEALDDGTLDRASIPTILFGNNPELKDASHAYLHTELTTNTDAKFLYFLADLVVNSRHILMLHEEHPLFQAAINALVLSDPTILRNPKNPYTLYHRLQTWAAAPIELHAPLTNIEGHKVRVSVQPLLDEAERSARATTFEQLPGAVHIDTLRNLFQRLDERLGRLSSSARALLLGQIEKQCASSYESLKNEMLEDMYLRRLLHTVGEPNERVSLDVMQFFTILQFILDQPDVAEEGTLLTQREHTLLAIATSIRNCPTGKKEGIFLAYNQIKGQAATTPSSDEEAAKAYLYSVIYQVLAVLLSGDTPFIKTLTRADPVEQLSHQTLYVKNLIGKRVGLIWDLTFDQSTDILYDDLISQTPQQALKLFFQYFTPQALIQALEEQVNRTLADTNSDDATKSEKANTLYHLLFGQLDEDQSYWATEEDEFGLPTSISLTTNGTMELLTKFGYLEEVEA